MLWVSTLRKTNACRVLDRLGIAYELKSYEVDESDLSTNAVARKVGLPLDLRARAPISREPLP